VLFVALSLLLGLSEVAARWKRSPASLAIIAYLMPRAAQSMAPAKRREIKASPHHFRLRAMPGSRRASWWQIDVLQLTRLLRHASAVHRSGHPGEFAIRGWMSRRPFPTCGVPFALQHGHDDALIECTTGCMSGPSGCSVRRGEPSPPAPWRLPLGQVGMCPSGLDAREDASGAEGHLFPSWRPSPTWRFPLPARHHYMNQIFIVERRQLRRIGPADNRREPHRPDLPIATVLLVNRWSRRRSASAAA